MIRRNISGYARLASTETVKALFPYKFDTCLCCKAFPDQLHTFVGDCSSLNLFVALVPEGDVMFTKNHVNGDNIIAIVGHQVSADYLEFLEEMQISYVFGGKDGKDIDTILKVLLHGFGLEYFEIEVARRRS